jgi:hypothetical protein
MGKGNDGPFSGFCVSCETSAFTAKNLSGLGCQHVSLCRLSFSRKKVKQKKAHKKNNGYRILAVAIHKDRSSPAAALPGGVRAFCH